MCDRPAHGSLWGADDGDAVPIPAHAAVEHKQPDTDAILVRPSSAVLNKIVRALATGSPAAALREAAAEIAAQATTPSDREAAYIDASVRFTEAAMPFAR